MADLNDVRRAATKHGWVDRMYPHQPIRIMVLTRRMSPDVTVSFNEHDGSFKLAHADFGNWTVTTLYALDEVLELLACREAPSESFVPIRKEDQD